MDVCVLNKFFQRFSRAHVDVVESFVKLVSPDLNMDRKVDLEDLNLQKRAFGSHLGKPNWNMTTDLDKDNVLNILDVSLVPKDYGKTVKLR